MEDGHAGIDRDGPANQLHRPRRIALLMGHHAKQVQGIRLAWLPGEDRLVQPRGLVQAAGLMMLKGEVQVVLGCHGCLVLAQRPRSIPEGDPHGQPLVLRLDLWKGNAGRWTSAGWAGGNRAGLTARSTWSPGRATSVQYRSE